MKELSASNEFSAEGKSYGSLFNQLFELVTHLKDKFHLFTKNVDVNGKNLTEHGKYAAEKADIVRAAIDEVGKGLKKQLVATEESTVSMEDMTEAIGE